MKIDMMRLQAVEMFRALEAVGPYVGCVQWTYAVAMNKRLLRPVVEAVSEAHSPPPEAVEFERRRTELAATCASKDKAGKPIVERGRIQLADPAAFAAGLTKIRTELPADAEGALELHLAALDRMLKEQVDPAIDLATCALEHVPDLPANLVEALMPMLVP